VSLFLAILRQENDTGLENTFPITIRIQVDHSVYARVGFLLPVHLVNVDDNLNAEYGVLTAVNI
jgi:hypothetical protein